MNSYKKVFLSFYQLLFISLILFAISFNSVHALSPNLDILFNQDLSIGDDNQDVLRLQEFLNQDSETRVAISGVGSLGQETTYFGNLTQNAVIKFQNKYAAEILFPVGLAYGTGYFGPSTRQKANDMILNDSFQQIELNLQDYEFNTQESTLYEDSQTNTSLANPEEILTYDPEIDSKIYYISKDPARQGQKVSIIAHGLKNSSRLYLEGYGRSANVSNLKIINDGNATFEMPNLDGGKYNLFIDNSGVLSEPFVVHLYRFHSRLRNIPVDYNVPEISSVSNQPIVYGDEVIITGRNFINPTKVKTPLGEYNVEPVNSSTIRLTFEKLEHLSEYDINEPYFESFLYLENSNGISDNFDTEFGSLSEGTLEENIAEDRANDEFDDSSNSVFDSLKGKLVKNGISSLTESAISSFTNMFSRSSSGSAGVSNPYVYGGNLLSTFPCPCSANLLMYIYDYKSNSVMPLLYQPGVSIVLAGSPTGFYQIGSYFPYGICLIPSATGCFEIPSRGTAGAGLPGYGTSGI